MTPRRRVDIKPSLEMIRIAFVHGAVAGIGTALALQGIRRRRGRRLCTGASLLAATAASGSLFADIDREMQEMEARGEAS